MIGRHNEYYSFIRKTVTYGGKTSTSYMAHVRRCKNCNKFFSTKIASYKTIDGWLPVYICYHCDDKK